MPDLPEEYHDLASLVRGKAEKNGDAEALVFGAVRFTYRSLDERTDRVAAGLRRDGIRAGDRVGVFLFNTPEFVEAWFALAKLRAVLVPLNTGLKGEILRYEISDSAPRALLLDRRLAPAFAAVRDALEVPRVYVAGPDGAAEVPGASDWSSVPAESPLPKEEAPAPEDPAAILYTSGTTGPPKGAIIPHEKYLRTPREIGARSRLAEGSRLFTALPLFHCNAQEMTAITALLHDRSAIFDERFHASTFWETAATHRATHVSLLIAMINVLYKQPERPTDRAHSVRTALTAGATAALWPEFEKRFGVTILELYGMTECGCTTIMNPPDRVRVGSIGTPLGFVEAEVVDDRDLPVPTGTRGELVVRPRAPYTMFLGYLNKPEKTVEAWRNLWFHTGDFVTRDADGYYYFVDRKKDVIRRRGENLAPYDVESVLNRHPGVFESVVVGVPSPLGEEDVKAFVLRRPGTSVQARELFEYCNENLPFFMVPRYVEFLEEIPKTANQKAQRYLLKGRRGSGEVDREALGIALKRP